MARRKLIFAAVTFFSLFRGASALSPPPPRPEVIAAMQWLELLDTKGYEKSWSEASRLFQTSHTMAGWIDEVRAVRDPLGTVYRRYIQSTAVVRPNELPGFPEGHYAIVRFPTTFSDAKGVHRVIEKVTVDEENAHWKVVGYLIE